MCGGGGEWGGDTARGAAAPPPPAHTRLHKLKEPSSRYTFISGLLVRARL